MKQGKVVKWDYTEHGSPIIACPAFTAPRKGHLAGRLVIDYRPFNTASEDIAWNAPDVNDIFQRLKPENYEYFCGFDLALGFNEIGLSAETSKLLAISTPAGVFRSLVLTLGPKQSPALFQMVTSSHFGTLTDDEGEFVAVYVDDLCFGAKDFEQLLTRLEKVYHVCDRDGFRLSLRKTQLAQPEVGLLGFKVSKNGRNIDEDKVKAVQEWGEFETSDDLHSFFCLCSYLREYIPELPYYHDKLKNYWLGGKVKFKEFQNDSKAQELVKELQNKVSSEVFLITPDYNNKLGFEVYVDASDIGYCWVICQRPTSEGTPRPIMMRTKSFTATQRAWSVMERELFSIVDFVRTGFSIVKGFPTTIFCDHKNNGSQELESIISRRGCKPKVIRWVNEIKMSLAQMNRVWLKGEENVLADYGSRSGSKSEANKEKDLQDKERQDNKVRAFINSLFDPPGEKTALKDEFKNKESWPIDPYLSSESESSEEEASSPPVEHKPGGGMMKAISWKRTSKPRVYSVKSGSGVLQKFFPRNIFYQKATGKWAVKYRDVSDNKFHIKSFSDQDSCWDWALSCLKTTERRIPDLPIGEFNGFHGRKSTANHFYCFTRPEKSCSLSLSGLLHWDPGVHFFKEPNEICSNKRLIRTEFVGGLTMKTFECLGHGDREKCASNETIIDDKICLPEKPLKKTVFMKEDQLGASAIYKASFLRPMNKEFVELKTNVTEWKVPYGCQGIQVAQVTNQEKTVQEVDVISLEDDSSTKLTTHGFNVNLVYGRGMQFGIKGENLILESGCCLSGKMQISSCGK